MAKPHTHRLADLLIAFDLDTVTGVAYKVNVCETTVSFASGHAATITAQRPEDFTDLAHHLAVNRGTWSGDPSEGYRHTCDGCKRPTDG